jgi:hypothetical protein
VVQSSSFKVQNLPWAWSLGWRFEIAGAVFLLAHVKEHPGEGARQAAFRPDDGKDITLIGKVNGRQRLLDALANVKALRFDPVRSGDVPSPLAWCGTNIEIARPVNCLIVFVEIRPRRRALFCV